ncbi:hypothetical protein FB567DRAFT_23173 [Paraphoma chrysanthemicola]|uniref:Uncharacterized protein n=1 Tax=Paraphoma chrysanthemicola TaxID=798071 RepID=A0A8K0RHP2_9PLEO|nr:hypothetical protein FB567DRAFT_23173 [Paraphoma chrysanthemicola]
MFLFVTTTPLATVPSASAPRIPARLLRSRPEPSSKSSEMSSPDPQNTSSWCKGALDSPSQPFNKVSYRLLKIDFPKIVVHRSRRGLIIEEGILQLKKGSIAESVESHRDLISRCIVIFICWQRSACLQLQFLRMLTGILRLNQHIIRGEEL